MKVILASGSPRRRELMEMLGIRCKVQASGAEEVVTSAEPEKVVEELSRLKCLDVALGRSFYDSAPGRRQSRNLPFDSSADPNRHLFYDPDTFSS